LHGAWSDKFVSHESAEFWLHCSMPKIIPATSWADLQDAAM